MKKFIIEYSPSWCCISTEGCPHYNDLNEVYQYARDRLNYSDGMIFGYNNAFWGMVKANNSAEALNIFFKKKESD